MTEPEYPPPVYDDTGRLANSEASVEKSPAESTVPPPEPQPQT